MRAPTKLEPWLSAEQLAAWMKETPDKTSYRRQLAIRLTHLRPHPAGVVASMLGVSKETAWKWASECNRQGPDGLERERRGGRRWGLLTEPQERAVLERFAARSRAGNIVSANPSLPEICAMVGHEVSLAHLCKLLPLQQWRKLAPRTRHAKADPEARAAFKRTFRMRSGRSRCRPQPGHG